MMSGKPSLCISPQKEVTGVTSGVYEQYNTDPVQPVLQNEARQQKRGLWSDADPVPPWIWRHRK